MRAAAAIAWVTLLSGGYSASVSAAESTSDDRLSASADGSTLSGSNGGGGGSLGWVHNFTADSFMGLGVEYQQIAGTHWTFGSLSASTSRALSNGKISVYGDVQKGAGDIGASAFDYSIVSAGLLRTFHDKYSLRIEDRQIDISTTHGNLPQLELGVLWNPQLLTTFSYAHSASGNLATDVGSVRIDRYTHIFTVFGGAGGGKASPVALDLQTGVAQPAGTLKEVFLGASKTLRRTDFTLTADYLDLAARRQLTVTLSCIVHLRAAAP